MREINEELVPTRIDKNIANNINGFTVQFAEDGILMRDIMLYMGHLSTSQQSLFETLTVDLNDFAKEFGYTAANLRRLHPNPKHIERLIQQKQYDSVRNLEKTDNSYHVFETVFENALYRLYIEKFELPRATNYVSRKVKDKDGADKTEFFSEVTLTAISLLLSIRYYQIINKNSRKQGVYECVLGHEFKHTLSQYFAQLSIKEVVKLRQPKVDSLYIFLSSLKDTLASKNECSTELNFNYLLKQANIEIDVQTRPRKAKQKLIEKFALLIDTDLQVRLDWRAANDGRTKYIPIVTFDQSDAMSGDERKIYMRNYWCEKFFEEIIILCKQASPKIDIKGVNDAMRCVLTFITSEAKKQTQTQRIAQRNALYTPLKNSYNVVYGVPKSIHVSSNIETMANAIIELDDINSIRSIFTNTDWYSKQQQAKEIKSRGFTSKL